MRMSIITQSATYYHLKNAVHNYSKKPDSIHKSVLLNKAARFNMVIAPCLAMHLATMENEIRKQESLLNNKLG